MIRLAVICYYLFRKGRNEDTAAISDAKDWRGCWALSLAVLVKPRKRYSWHHQKMDELLSKWPCNEKLKCWRCAEHSEFSQFISRRAFWCDVLDMLLWTAAISRAGWSSFWLAWAVLLFTRLCLAIVPKCMKWFAITSACHNSVSFWMLSWFEIQYRKVKFHSEDMFTSIKWVKSTTSAKSMSHFSSTSSGTNFPFDPINDSISFHNL